MDVMFNQEIGRLVISFESYEARDSLFLMQLVFEEEERRGMLVPDFDAAFFERLVSVERKRWVRFSYDYLELMIIFLEEARIELVENDMDISRLKKSLDEIRTWLFGTWYSDHRTIH
ncbi:MAG: hypothetical protein ACYC1Y_01710 [Minisyncoccota bacterium]